MLEAGDGGLAGEDEGIAEGAHECELFGGHVAAGVGESGCDDFPLFGRGGLSFEGDAAEFGFGVWIEGGFFFGDDRGIAGDGDFGDLHAGEGLINAFFDGEVERFSSGGSEAGFHRVHEAERGQTCARLTSKRSAAAGSSKSRQDLSVWMSPARREE